MRYTNDPLPRAVQECYDMGYGSNELKLRECVESLKPIFEALNKKNLDDKAECICKDFFGFKHGTQEFNDCFQEQKKILE